MDEAVANRDARSSRLNRVETRSRDTDVLDLDVLRAVDLDPDLAAGDRDVADGHVVGRDHDSPVDDRAAVPDQLLPMVDQKGSLMNAGGEVHRGRLRRPRDSSGGGEDGHGRSGRGRTRPAELAAILPVGEPGDREGGVDEDLAEEQGASEEEEGEVERCGESEGGDDRDEDAELEQRERQGKPARLVGKEAVIDRRVEREAGADHDRPELHRPPRLEHERSNARGCQRHERRRQTRLQSPSQRVRHARMRRRNRLAAYLWPASVSAAGKAHWPGTPAIESVRVSSVSAGIVESGASAIQPSAVSRAWASTSAARRESFRKPLLKPVAQMICSLPLSSGTTLKRPSRRARSTGSSQSRPPG